MEIQLFLSSQGFSDNCDLLRPQDPALNHAFIVLNALDPYPNARQSVLPREIAGLSALGYTCQELDLRDYFHQPHTLGLHNQALTSALITELTKPHLIWVVGGNTFTLARAMNQSHFKEALSTALVMSNHSITYGGYSAGAAIVGTDLQGIHLMDNADQVPALYDPTIAATSLHLTNVRVIPHYGSTNDDGTHAQEAVAFLERGQLAYRALSDGEVWITHAEMHTSPHPQPE